MLASLLFFANFVFRTIDCSVSVVPQCTPIAVTAPSKCHRAYGNAHHSKSRQWSEENGKPEDGGEWRGGGGGGETEKLKTIWNGREPNEYWRQLSSASTTVIMIFVAICEDERSSRRTRISGAKHYAHVHRSHTRTHTRTHSHIAQYLLLLRCIVIGMYLFLSKKFSCWFLIFSLAYSVASGLRAFRFSFVRRRSTSNLRNFRGRLPCIVSCLHVIRTVCLSQFFGQITWPLKLFARIDGSESTMATNTELENPVCQPENEYASIHSIYSVAACALLWRNPNKRSINENGHRLARKVRWM